MFMLLFTTKEARADEWIRYYLNDVTSEGTIIRHYKDSVDIVCCHNSSGPYFIVYKDGVVSSSVLYLHGDMEDIDTICDFEIFNDTIYFCGRKSTFNPIGAVVGYYDVSALLSMASVNVNYIPISTVDIVNAMEVGTFASRKHVVGVGENNKSKQVVVDLIDETTHWDVYYGEIGGDTILLSDLAITNKKIIVTSVRTGSLTIPAGQIWHFPKPTVPGSSLFPCTVLYDIIKNSFGINGKFLVKAATQDSFITVNRNKVSIPAENSFTISYYKILNYKNVVVSEEAEGISLLGDFDIDSITQDIGLLVYRKHKNTPGLTRSSVIYEIPDIYPIPSFVQTHVYKDVLFSSLDYIDCVDSYCGYYVSSGFRSPGYDTPYYMRFRKNFFDGYCLDKTESPARNIALDHDYSFIDVTGTLVQPETVELLKYLKNVNVKTECHSYRTMDDEGSDQQD